MRVAVIGGSGFVGQYLVDALLVRGHQPVLLLRPSSRDKLNRADAVETVPGDIGDEVAIEATLRGCDACIYLVGILRESKKDGVTFEETQYRGVVRALEAAKKTGAHRFLLMSANGVKPGGTPYQDSKYRAEQAAFASGLDVTVFRPSVIFGDPRGQMEIATQLFRDMVRPPLPAVGFYTGWRPGKGAILMSPVHVEDVAMAFVTALDMPAAVGEVYELGGATTLSWQAMIERVAEAAGKNKLIAPLPIALMWPPALCFGWLPWFPVTTDQLRMLAEGNTAEANALEALIGRPARSFESPELSYLR